MIDTVLAAVLVLGGLFFMSVSGVGIVRLPDVYCRNHAVGKSETLGSILLLFGLAIYNGFHMSSAKLLLILVFILLANPTATHLIAQAAFRSGLQPWVLGGTETGENAGRPEDNRRTNEDPARQP